VRLLTSTDVAALLGVSTGTIKRWTDAGRLVCARTAGRHRRFTAEEVERFRRGQDGGPGTGTGLVDRLLGDEDMLSLQATLLEQRARLGSWRRVADWVAPEIEELGRRWQDGRIGVVEEHLASERLTRVLGRSVEALPARPSAPSILLAAAEGEEHVLGLALAELCFKEEGWNTRWAGRRTPTAELVRLVEGGSVHAVALSASVTANRGTLLAQTTAVGQACARRGVHLVLGGRGEWPDPPPYGSLVRDFDGLRAWMSAVEAALPSPAQVSH
jgi:excisionase family DNA binding protein